MSFLGSGTISLPRVTCQHCTETFTPSAIREGCFYGSPIDAHMWYDMRLLDTYQVLGLNDGLSMSGFVDYLNEANDSRIDDRQFLNAVFAYLRAVRDIDSSRKLGVSGLDEGPFADCCVLCEGRR
ncbi:hypothetical protein VaNZ11_016354 [Volvox africanus]|uniref:Uncharacterized protein n=1 Tax=Volvox africanus TaxID=51714 RepID=A0ABQ5SP84_9CHLO|nr:hypothetical protein VaNZ11_016354 [Volvox africanus]